MTANTSRADTSGNDALGTGEGRLADLAALLGADASRASDEVRRAELGQFPTPPAVALFMASMFGDLAGEARVLDAGAGVGTLTAALVDELLGRERRPDHVSVSAYEADPSLLPYLKQVVCACGTRCELERVRFSGEVLGEDFVEAAVAALGGSMFGPPEGIEGYDLAILNPPYAKLGRSSETRRMLRSVGIEVPNLYAAFVALAVELLADGGELVAITPRSFCNGPYFGPFRKALLAKTAIQRMHVYEARDRVFGGDGVLQENVIFHAVKGGPRPEKVVVSSSAGGGDQDESPDDEAMALVEKPYDRLVEPEDPDSFVRIATAETGQTTAERMASLPCSLTDLGLSVSTGRVVDFRAKEHLRSDPGKPSDRTVPLLYPKNLRDGSVVWPGRQDKKPAAIARAEGSERLLVPKGPYVLVKRFSAKEEKRRVVAAVCDPARLPAGPYGFENHLNYYHEAGAGLASVGLARGLAAFLNSTILDSYFRQFSGHTQVNATDLRKLRYPTREQLEGLGTFAGEDVADATRIDGYLEREVFAVGEGGVTGGPDPVVVENRLAEGIAVLRELGLPRAQQNERSALTLLTLLGLGPEAAWSTATDSLLGVNEMMDLFAERYGRRYAPNTRETVRRQTLHQFLAAGLVLKNPDDPNRPVNSPHNRYQVEPGVLALLRSRGTPEWEAALKTHLASVEALKTRYAREREMAKIPVTLPSGEEVPLSPGGQNVLIEKIVHEFCPRFTPGGRVLYLGDAAGKWTHFEREELETLGVSVEEHGKMPDVVVHHAEKGWLVLVEAVTSHGPVDPKRVLELKELFAGSSAGLVLVTAFLDRRAMVRYLSEIAWETEVWVADAPEHLIHFDGERFLGPY